MPVLSIVTPVFQSGEYLRGCLDSVAALGVPHEHVVVDGGSTDGTVELLRSREDPALRWTSEPDRGQTHAVNKGLERATGELLMWVNGDDEVVPEGVEAAVAHLRANPACQAVYGGLDYTDADGALRRRTSPAAWSWRRYLLLGDYVQTPTFVFRRARALAVGPLDERWVDAADYDFYLRLTHGVRVDRMPGVHVRFRYHESSKSARDMFKQLDEAQRIRLQWSRGIADRAVMVGFDRFKRVALPILTRGRWPAPFDDA
ncbi:MAG TPA: glycosyltransferase family 2 protein [Solirubrobacteraceae bacterium]|jgi:glycosyltransferase involved in cell wall biosynthesis|nr:glycosyltransferase family 2 protein [Solirubrobacteraceae bacterium]